MKEWSKYHTSVSTPVTIRGVTYPSIWQAAKAMGCSATNIRKAHKEGWLDRVGIKTKERKNDVDRTSNHTRRT